MAESQSRIRIKLAVLILAHKNMEQLKRLISRLLHKNIDVFIHIDKKWAITDKDETELQKIINNKVFLCDNRISGKLFEWSLVEATLELIRKAHEVEARKKIRYNYYALLSGQDYPIKAIDYILDLLSNSYPKPFIDCTPYHPTNFMKKKFKTLPLENKMLLLFLKYYSPNPIFKNLFRIIKIPVYSIFFILKTFILTPIKKLKKLNCDLYGGSQWWILPDITINEIYQRYFNNKDEIINIISNSFGPDETFFQIMTMQSKTAPLVEVNDINNIKQNCLTYAYFRDEGKPFTGHPYILKVENFDKLLTIPHCFARKFDETIDAEVLNLIDKEIFAHNNLAPNISHSYL